MGCPDPNCRGEVSHRFSPLLRGETTQKKLAWKYAWVCLSRGVWMRNKQGQKTYCSNVSSNQCGYYYTTPFEWKVSGKSTDVMNGFYASVGAAVENKPLD